MVTQPNHLIYLSGPLGCKGIRLVVKQAGSPQLLPFIFLQQINSGKIENVKLKNPKKLKKYYDDRMDTSTQNKMMKHVQKPTNTNLNLDVSSIGLCFRTDLSIYYPLLPNTYSNGQKIPFSVHRIVLKLLILQEFLIDYTC